MSLIERIWFGDDAAAAAARIVLSPFSLVYAGVMRARGAMYDAGALSQERATVPVVSVGNLTVGGTGKTPVAAWLAGQLAQRATPGIVLRGYGADEVEVHRRLNPAAPVVANPDRVAGTAEAVRRGANVIVLDDAFQHRRVARDADVLVLSAEQMLRPRRVLPAGAWREPLSEARRADLIIVTRKSASRDRATEAARIATAAAPGVPVVIVHLSAASLASATDAETAPLDRLRGADVLAIAAIGEPSLFREQLEAFGARVSLAAFRDHHPFSGAEIDALATRARAGLAVCTLKDAVKLGPRWPGPNRLWYVSQQLAVDEGAEHVERLITRVLNARASAAPSAG